MDIPHGDTNPDSEVLYTMNIDTQKVFIVVDKESTGKTDVATGPPATGSIEEKLAVDNTEKQVEQQAPSQEQVHVETVPPTTSGQCKPFLREMQTQIDLPEVTTSKEITHTNGIQIVGSSIVEFRPTNVTKVLLDSIKKIIECSSQEYKAIDDTIPILKMIAPKCNVDNKDSLNQLDTLSKYITNNIVTVEQINEEAFKEKLEK